MSKNLDEKEISLLEASLQKLDFTDKEARVYIALLSLGEVGSSKILKETDLHGQYVYQALASLEERELVQHRVKSGRKRFKANHPKVIERLMTEKALLADKVVSELQEYINLPLDQTFNVSQGVEEYVNQEFHLLKEADTGSELLIIGGAGDQFMKNMKGYMEKYEKIRLDKKISVKYIGSKEQAEDLSKIKESRELFDFRILPGLFTGSVNTNIWPKSIGFNIYGSPVVNFSLFNPTVAGSYKKFFETLWSMGKE